jgi:hypothetical protein
MATKTLNGFSIGDKVYFGRTHGEQTLGEVAGLGRTKLKVKQLEQRGTMRSYPIGTIWTVPVSLCRKAAGAPVTVPAAAAPAPPAAPVQGMDDPKEFARKAAVLGLPADCLGQWIELGRGKRVQIVGINLRRPEYPVSVQGTQGGRYKLTVFSVKTGLALAGKPSTAPAPKTRRPEAEIMSDIVGCYGQLSPENLSCDGELSMSQQRRKAAEINRRLRDLQTELGRSVSEDEADRWYMQNRSRRSA